MSIGGWAMLTGNRILLFLRRDLVLAISLTGLALNLIGGLQPLLAITRLAHFLVEHWVQITAFIWIKLFALIHVHIPPLLGFSLTMFLFHCGLVAESLRRRDRAAARVGDTKANDRDRLIAILLYIPILWGTLASAFSALAAHASEPRGPANGALIALSFCLVVGSPILVFTIATPRLLVRRFISVWIVALAIGLLDLLARVLEFTGLGGFIANRT
jgi:hypothetical protein